MSYLNHYGEMAKFKERSLDILKRITTTTYDLLKD